jgi:nifR3 family TIM-barrel protein
MGCPVNKIFSNGEGSALMKNPSLIEKIVRAVKDSVNIPVTAKIRTGIDENSINAVDCALALEAGGADALCIHGRTRKQMYSGTVDRKTIREVKNSLHIPLIANGDITSVQDAIDMLSETGADGISIGRGAVGNPFIFDEIRSALTDKEYTPPTLEERIETALLQLKIAVEDKGERIAVCEARKQIALYLKGHRGASSVRGEINKATTYKEVEDIFLSLKG